MDWDTVKHFKPEEWGKDPDKVHPLLVHIIDEIREVSGVPISIHVAYDFGGHSSKSYHYREPSLAVDLHFKAGIIPYTKQLQLFLMYPEINAIGFYPQWAHPGWHCDLRQPPRLFWEQKNGVYNYYNDTQKFFNLVGKYDA